MLTLAMADANLTWGYDRISGALHNLGFNVSDEAVLWGQRYLIHDRDSKFCVAFSELVRSAGIEALKLPPNSPNLNAFAERWVRSVKEECLSQLVLFGDEGLRRALKEYVSHYHEKRNRQGKGNLLLFPSAVTRARSENAPIECSQRFGGLLKYYYCQAA